MKYDISHHYNCIYTTLQTLYNQIDHQIEHGMEKKWKRKYPNYHGGCIYKILQSSHRCQALLHLGALSLSIFASGFSLCLKLEIPCTILSVNPSNLTVIYVCLSLIWENYHSSFDLFLRCVKPHHHFQRIGEFFTSPEREYSVIWKYKWPRY